MSIRADDWSAIAKHTLDAFQQWIADGSAGDWQVEEPNYEGVRIRTQDSWLLLRSSLHDPLLVVNAESDVAGGAWRLACAAARVTAASCAVAARRCQATAGKAAGVLRGAGPGGGPGGAQEAASPVVNGGRSRAICRPSELVASSL